MTQVHVFTSAAFNYIPKVRMLFNSLREHHPEWRLHLALADELRPNVDLSKEPFDEVHPLSELDIPHWKAWAFCHTIVELATAIKPFTLSRLLALPDTAKVIYLDPDTVAFSRLDDIVAALDESNVVLTPHQITPESSLSAVMDNEICSLKHGVYNLGFAAVAATDTGKAFANWWGERIYHFCRADIPNGLFTDQKWIDLVPALFEGVAIMRTPRHNVAPWNLTTREITIDDNGTYLVNGEPLGFYHFTGFDSGAHRVMAAKNGGTNSAVSKLVNWYDDETQKLAEDPLAKEVWAYGQYSDGTPISKGARAVYRERVDLQRAFPEPFDATGYKAWWETQGKVEYPQFHDKKQEAAALLEFSKVLTPGFRGGMETMDWARVGGLLKQSIMNPKTGGIMAKKGWEVLRNQGLRGLKNKLLG